MAETIKGLNIKLGLDSTELNEKLSQLKSTLKEQQNDLKAINSRLKYDPSNIDLWKEKQSKLNESLRLTKERLNAQNAKLKDAKKSLEIGAISETEFNKLRRNVEYTEADIAKLNNELQETNKKITALGNVKWDRLAKIGSTLTKYITLPVIGATTALATLSYKALNTADELADNASKVYLSAEAYQEWAYACEILAVDSNQLQKAFVKVNALLGDIANGDASSVSEKLKLIGLTAEDLKGLNTDEAFMKIRDALSKLNSEAERTAVANEIFGDKLGAELTQVLSASTDKIDELRKSARELGIVSNEDAEVAGEFTDKITDLKRAFSSLQFEISKAFLPILEKIVDCLTQKVIPTIKKMISWWNNLSTSIKVVIGVIGGLLVAIGPILSIVGKIIPLVMKLKNAFTAVNGAIQIAGASIKLSTLGWVLQSYFYKMRNLGHC